MSSSITQSKGAKSGLCPHGLPPAACPICSGKMGGGGKMRNSAIIKKSNEWSYMKCYAAWMNIKSKKAHAENQKQAVKNEKEFAQKLAQEINNLKERIAKVIEQITNTDIKIIQIPVQIINTIILKPILAILSALPKIIEKLIQYKENFQNFIQQILDKLTAIKGEIKNIIYKNFTEKIKQKAKKIFLFFINNLEDENYKNDDTLAVFKSRELRKYLIKILKRDKKRSQDGN